MISYDLKGKINIDLEIKKFKKILSDYDIFKVMSVINLFFIVANSSIAVKVVNLS